MSRERCETSQNPVLPLRRFVRSSLRRTEQPDFIRAVLDFSDAAFNTEQGIGDYSYHVSVAVRRAEKAGIKAQDVGRASEVAVNLWREFNTMTNSDGNPTQFFEPLSPQIAEKLIERFREQRLSREKDSTDQSSMTTNRLILIVARKTGLSQKAAGEAINAFLSEVSTALQNEKRVVISGFGTFEVRTRVTRKGRNPQTGENITIGEHKVPGFTAGKTIKRKFIDMRSYPTGEVRSI